MCALLVFYRSYCSEIKVYFKFHDTWVKYETIKPYLTRLEKDHRFKTLYYDFGHWLNAIRGKFLLYVKTKLEVVEPGIITEPVIVEKEDFLPFLQLITETFAKEDYTRMSWDEFNEKLSLLSKKIANRREETK
ncbi:MAG: hypothetical protein ACOY9Y_01245 [Bacillota bacterium]